MRRILSLKLLFLSLSILGLLLAVLLFYALWHAHLAQDQLVATYENRYQSYLLADQLRQSSDDLTRMARTYVVTGNQEFEKQYWQVLAIRNGQQPRPQHYERIYWDFVAAGMIKPRPDGEAIPLQELMLKAGFSAAEFAKLREAQAYSDTLVRTETIAMNAMKGRFDENGDGVFDDTGAPDPQLAQRLMHDQHYHEYKAQIMKPLDEFFLLLDQRTQNNVQHAHEVSNQAYLQVTLLTLATLLIGSFALWLLYWWLKRQIGGEPDTARFIVKAIAGGNLAVAIHLRANDRSSLLAAMAHMRNSLAIMISKLEHHATQLAETAMQLAETAGLMARQHASQDSANQSMATAVEQMSSSVAEITSTMEELSASSKQIADHSQSVVDVASQTLDSSRQGASAMQHLLERMNDIRNDNHRNLEEIVALGAKSKEIGKIMDIIETVANQTKLIAFNAALEASSAGESGKRFSVVASEIRRLADSVTESTREIESRIQEIQDAISRLVISSEKGAHTIDSGLSASHETAQILETLVQGASQTTSAAQKISLSTQQQKTANIQVVQALREIASASTNTSRAVRKISDTSEILLDVSDILKNLFAQFHLADHSHRSHE
jgi:methyl-accepting chemotaxis protein